MDRVLSFLVGLPPLLVYAVLGAGAALENVIPPIPADTFVLLGGFLSARGGPDPVLVFLVTWACNVGSALAVFALARRHGPTFFQGAIGRRLLNPWQMDRMARFYARWGPAAIFCARFLPGLRAVVPPSAGATGLPWWKAAPPMVLASGIWYGGLVWLGAAAGGNLDRLSGWLARANGVLLLVAALVVGAAGAWWWRTRRSSGDVAR